MVFYIYFGRNYVILSLNIYHREIITYKQYNDIMVLKKIIEYCKKEDIYNLIIISNKLFYRISNVNKEFNIKCKVESKNKIKNKLEYYKIYKL